MAIADLLLTCDDKNRRGGIKKIYYQDITNITSFTVGADHEYSAVTMDTTADDWFELEGTIQEKVFDSESSNENGSGVFDNTLEVLVPKLEEVKAEVLQSMVESCEIVFIIEFYNKTAGDNNIGMVLGWDELLEEDAGMSVNVNATSGRTLQDPNGYTMIANGQSAETPRIFSGTITLAQDSSTRDFS